MRRKGINSTIYDNRDKEILKRLASEHKCQERILVDGGRHYIFCGAYYKRPAMLVGKRWLCESHQ